MLKVDKITDEDKSAITNLLNKSIEIEYSFIFNYPRMIDQLVNIEPIIQEKVAGQLEQLGKESVQHAGWIMRLVENLGGEPVLPLEGINRIADISALLLKQLEKEKSAQSLFKEAKLIAEQNQAEGILTWIKAMRSDSTDKSYSRSSTIHILERLEIDEGRHVKIVQNLLSDLNLPMQ
ncbi:MAG: ferritin-like domain-containing protein [Dehalococcoidales bacterium]|nr:ferritin-like domain-containing protein [Dehalococcoidales bacterium]